MNTDRITTSLQGGALYGAAALVGTAVLAAGYPLVVKVNSLINRYLPSLYGTMNATLVISASSMIALPLSEKNTAGKVAGALIILGITAAATPKLASKLFNTQISYLNAALYGLMAATIFLIEEYSAGNEQESSFKTLVGKSVKIGLFSLVGGASVLLAIKTVAFVLKKRPMIWGTLPAGAALSLSTFIALPLAQYIAEDKRRLWMAIQLTLTFLATTFITAKLSTLSPYRVNYYQAAAFAALGSGLGVTL
ncbi:MAG: hypothetical protein K1060chlam2_00964, partial [Chlamydiae bacterium]|nr:hypothetical protein [Chlamydiota bacterium]